MNSHYLNILSLKESYKIRSGGHDQSFDSHKAKHERYKISYEIIKSLKYTGTYDLILKYYNALKLHKTAQQSHSYQARNNNLQINCSSINKIQQFHFRDLIDNARITHNQGTQFPEAIWEKINQYDGYSKVTFRGNYKQTKILISFLLTYFNDSALIDGILAQLTTLHRPSRSAIYF